MDNKYYNVVIEEMKPFFEEQGFKMLDDGSFRNDKKAFAVNYDDERQMYVLKGAEVENDVVGEFSELSSWLFDDTQNEKDAVSVGIDFTSTVREKMGVKIKRAAVAEVELPSASKSGAVTVAGFTKKVLDVFPQYKDAYKAHIAKYGNFLYFDFFSESLVPQIKSVLSENNKKQNKKLFEMLENAYIGGDKETVNAVVAVCAAAVYENEELKSVLLELLAENAHFKSSVENFIPVFVRKKALISALVK